MTVAMTVLDALRRPRIAPLARALAVIALALTAGATVPAAAEEPFDAAEPGAMAPTQPDPALARQFAEGLAAYDAGDYRRAFDLWLPLARNNDLAAQRNVAHMLRLGLGVEKDAPRALQFYRRSAEFGFVTSQVNLAAMLLAGEGTDPDPEEAAAWFDRAARGGHPLAQYNLARLYETGEGVEQNMALALGWYALAARGGNAQALDRLAALVPTLPGPGTETEAGAVAPGAGDTGDTGDAGDAGGATADETPR